MNIRKYKQVPELIKGNRLRRPDRLALRLPQRNPIPKIRKSVPLGLGNPIRPEILPSRILHRLEKMEDRPSVNRHDRPVNAPPLIPAAAPACPHGSLQVFLDVLVVFFVGGVVDFETADRFGLQFAEPFVDVDCCCLDAEN